MPSRHGCMQTSQRFCGRVGAATTPLPRRRMRRFFQPNLESRGRLARGLTALACLIGGVIGWRFSAWLGLGLLVTALFVAFEALRGWCVLRACGIKTRL